MATWWNPHAHSNLSVQDGMPAIEEMVETTVANGQPALGLMDHGRMAGVLDLYSRCRKAGILPFPGEEFYLVTSVMDDEAKKHRYHVGLLALSERGYEILVQLSSRSYTRERFYNKPLIDFTDLQALDARDDIALFTGCYFGLLAQTVIKHGVQAGVGVVQAFAQSVPLTYVEIQHHSTDHGDGWDDTALAHKLLEVADIAGLPVIVTQDSHYCHEHQKPVHDLMKAMTMFGADPGDVTFPGDSYHQATTQWVKDHYAADRQLRRIWNEGLQSSADLLERNRVKIPVIDNYSFRVPDLGWKDPERELLKLCSNQLKAMGLGKRYLERLDYELGIISDTGFSNYFLLVHDIVSECLSSGWLVRARGSATGALVCYLLGITDVDPIRWKLSFDRFLTRDRSKPPDIDLDIEDRYRGLVVQMLKDRIESVVQIGTYSTLGYDERTDRGSIVDDYVRMQKRITGNYAGNFMDDIEEGDREVLMELAGMSVRRNAGAHAAGFLLGTSEVPIEKYIPTMLINPSAKDGGRLVTQVEMDDCENAGFTKMDLLGLRYLTTLHLCLDLIGEHEYGQRGEFIPYNDSKTMTELRHGRMDSALFQMEGYTAAKGCREMQVKSTNDCILIMALYRPAAIDSGYKDLFLKNRARPARVTYSHPVMEKHLKETFGLAVYQEQVLEICRDFGMTVEELNKILKAVKMSGKRQVLARKAFADAEAGFMEHLFDQGLDEDVAEEVWSLVKGFAEYGFNRNHATSYGVLAYRIAYLKVHHPLEYMAAVLMSTSGDDDDQKRYMREAKRLGLPIRRPCVNRGASNWTIETGRTPALRRGLQTIKGVGEKAANEIEANAPYDSMEDLIDRTQARLVTGGKEWKKDGTLRGVLEILRQAGALADLGVNP